MGNDTNGADTFETPDIGTGEDAAIPLPNDQSESNMSDSELTRVMRKYEQELFALDGVVGMDIQANDIGDDVIAIYIRDESVRKNVPNQLDGFPVMIIVSGEIDAQGQ